MTHEIEYIFGIVALAMIAIVGIGWGVAVIPAFIAVVAALFHADAKRDGM